MPVARRRAPPQPAPLEPGESWITIAGPRGDRHVRAFVLPQTEELLSVRFEDGSHELDDEPFEPYWSVSHLPSGLLIAGPHRPYPKTREEATVLALAFLREWRRREWPTLHTCDVGLLRDEWGSHSHEERALFWRDVYGCAPPTLTEEMTCPPF